MENPWDIKRRINACLKLADELGFELRDKSSRVMEMGEIYLFRKPDADVFTKELTLMSFQSWDGCMTWLMGYERAVVAQRMRDGVKKTSGIGRLKEKRND